MFINPKRDMEEYRKICLGEIKIPETGPTYQYDLPDNWHELEYEVQSKLLEEQSILARKYFEEYQKEEELKKSKEATT
jgi:hypothetical protein